MSSVAAVLVCVALPVLFGYHNRVETAPTAQRIHWRRRLQHATCGVAVTCGYKWVIRDAWTGDTERVYLNWVLLL